MKRKRDLRRFCEVHNHAQPANAFLCDVPVGDGLCNEALPSISSPGVKEKIERYPRLKDMTVEQFYEWKASLSIPKKAAITENVVSREYHYSPYVTVFHSQFESKREHH